MVSIAIAQTSFCLRLKQTYEDIAYNFDYGQVEGVCIRFFSRCMTEGFIEIAHPPGENGKLKLPTKIEWYDLENCDQLINEVLIPLIGICNDRNIPLDLDPQIDDWGTQEINWLQDLEVKLWWEDDLVFRKFSRS